MIYQSRAIEQYPTGIRALLAGVSGLLYRRSTWVAFFVETAAARSRADQAKRVRPTTCSGEIRPGRIWSYRRPYLVSRALGGIWGGICEYRQYFVFLTCFNCGNSVPAPAPAPEHGEREPELPEHFLVRHLGLKRPAEASPPVSPEKPRAAERVVSDDELDPEDDDAPAPADVDERTRFAKPMGSDRERWEARLNESVVDDQILQGCSPKCGCVFAHGLVLKDQVLANRAQFAGMSEANWDNDEGFQIPLILLQLPDDFEGKDTTDENLKLKPKWYASRRCAANRSSR